MGVVWGAKFLGIPQKERVNAGDFLPDFFAQCIARKHRVALVGGHPDEAEQTTAALREMLPDLPDVFHRDGFFTEDNEPEILQQLAEFQPDIILIGRGSPRQEETMFRWLETADYQPAVYWCVGALFEYFSGNRYRAPVWVRKLGFEWLVRLILEPRRLARRYLIGNVTFIWHIVCGKLRR
jgi:exopolysaccharide biosynthesis WecB/TagA/CpsF family protein